MPGSTCTRTHLCVMCVCVCVFVWCLCIYTYIQCKTDATYRLMSCTYYTICMNACVCVCVCACLCVLYFFSLLQHHHQHQNHRREQPISLCCAHASQFVSFGIYPTYVLLLPPIWHSIGMTWHGMAWLTKQRTHSVAHSDPISIDFFCLMCLFMYLFSFIIIE